VATWRWRCSTPPSATGWPRRAAHWRFGWRCEDEVALPTSASLLGTPVTVVALDYTDPARGLVAVCRSPQGTGEVAFADVAFPADTLAAWLHAAYRHHLGLKPFPATPKPDWTWPPD
jgi:hypothetical protein